MAYVVGVEGQRVGCTLRTAPEGLTGAGDGILRQAEEQLPDGVVVLLFKLQTGPDDALLEGQGLVADEVRDKLFDLLLLLARVLQVVLEEVRLREVRVGGLRRLDEEVVELRPRPLRTASGTIQTITV